RPASPRCPYTTLFRSTVGLEQLRDLETGVIPPNRFSAKTLLALAERLRAPLTAFVGLIRITVLPSPAVTATAKTATRMKRSTTSDRKSTRLNSSHVSI